ncbi:MAG TPA: YbaK/EbsC family protein [Dongiaceae bacterium]|jgi:prolyl-tRNA editing enzyme YbaK/EbsC (Cys-tRNA(Pro) deacylase)|nr:YbaK/EbsC family protein [Dongiaceae bacterium]
MAQDAGESGKSSVTRVRQALAELGLEAEIKEFSASTRTSADAAAAIGCSVAQIAKSLVFRTRPSGRAVLVMASGANRVDEAKLAARLGENIGKADAGFVRAETGFAIGGVAPVGHDVGKRGMRLRTLIDRDLLQYDVIWAAAGSPNSVFRLTPDDLVRITQGEVADLKL